MPIGGIGGGGIRFAGPRYPFDPAEPLGSELPFLPEACDFFVGAANEFPAHQDRLRGRHTAEQHQPRQLRRGLAKSRVVRAPSTHPQILLRLGWAPVRAPGLPLTCVGPR